MPLEFKDQLSEAYTVGMCTQGRAWDLRYVPQMTKPQTLQDLATKPHNTKVTIANRRDNSFSVAELKKDRVCLLYTSPSPRD